MGEFFKLLKDGSKPSLIAASSKYNNCNAKRRSIFLYRKCSNVCRNDALYRGCCESVFCFHRFSTYLKKHQPQDSQMVLVD